MHVPILQKAHKPYLLHQMNQQMHLRIKKDVGICIFNKLRTMALSLSIVETLVYQLS
jgi:hypothetical protein